jgi:hypothetical protein
MTESPRQTLRLLRAELHPVPPTEAKQIEAWLAQLDDSAFKVRDLAFRELERFGDGFEPLISKALGNNPTLEMRQRVELLLKKLASPASGETLRILRAIAVLEAIGGEDARSILQQLAGGAQESRITQAARGAVRRVR